MFDTMDEALTLLGDTGPEYGGGLANHGPMAAEALVALGRREAVLPWVQNYKRRLRERPASQKPISPEDWREALGDSRRVGDWIVFFERELEAPWRDALNVWVPRLAPGFIAAAAHGIIRTSHAARSLQAAETNARLNELAQGLAYWAARYQVLPAFAEASAGRPVPAGPKLSPTEAIDGVQVLPREMQDRGGLITSGLEGLSSLASFPEVIDRVDASGDASRFVSNLTETFTRVYLANDRRRFIALLHAVTGTGAIRLLLPHLSAESTAPLLRYGWQAGAALYAAFAENPRPQVIDPPREGRDELVDRAVATGDEHAFKFTETCLREHGLNPKPEYLAAIRHVTEILG